MAHIASCVANLENGYISKPSSPSPSMLSTTPPTSTFDKAFTWRMLPADAKKYQLFPKDKPLPSLNANKTLDPEMAFELAMSDKHAAGSNLRLRLNQHASARRRKISVPELEPMTTVQEVAMDSPTIPGRPPLHERSISAPNDERVPTLLKDMSVGGGELSRSVERGGLAPRPVPKDTAAQSVSRQLAPLVIPISELPAPLLQSRNSSAAKNRSDSTPPMSSSRSARMDISPMSRTRITPSSSTPDLLYTRYANTDGASTTTLPTPISAPIMESYRASPMPWDSASIISAQSDRGASDGQRKPYVHMHRRGASESSTSVMDRGRPRKRVEVRNNNGPILKGTESKRAMSSERRAFEELPKGWKASEVTQKLSPSDIISLQKQALGQAERFEVLKVEDVDALSKELRRLDERTDYLRRTYTSLRAGRRNLHSRICQYLRSPRVAKFSYDSMLKQEEALAELDASIDDWVSKLEQAENRRTRVRQKLLEHVAAAAILPIGANQVSTVMDSLQQVMGIQSPAGPRELSTPPRSPSKSTFASRVGNASPSPQRVVAQVPSTILEQPVVEDAAEGGTSLSRAASAVTLKRGDVESIRIYAGDDVYALLADVENEISKMGGGSPIATTPEPVVAKEGGHEDNIERERQRQRSHEKLNGDCPTPLATTPPVRSAVSANSTVMTLASPASTPDTTPTTHSPSPAASLVGSKPTTGLVASLITSINRDAKNNTPSPLSPTAKAGGFLLTSAVFKP
ncbi:hypothetical protein QQS21_005952 [Conoideocrella luteorostrata]|uniref:Up-regulated during septation protein 1 domain-containing protein n=1 Tax=Conoideocrella luteorostrata TaxID=1105319 RepID=A0AAJ0CNJ7_9HYPO|nr:hypothetical protein QQS21_005952 [Conoideocrella luteorostrata]